eukprot:24722-Chlamydomonas_euryale.AAC.3
MAAPQCSDDRRCSKRSRCRWGIELSERQCSALIVNSAAPMGLVLQRSERRQCSDPSGPLRGLETTNAEPCWAVPGGRVCTSYLQSRLFALGCIGVNRQCRRPPDEERRKPQEHLQHDTDP